MKKRWASAVILIACVMNNAFATLPGFYLGGQLGWGNVHQGTYVATYLNKLITKFVPDAPTDSLKILYSDTGLAGRVFGGYQFNSYVGLELGYYHFNRMNVNTDLQFAANFPHLQLPLDFKTHATVNTNVFDLVAKLIWPITEKFSLYGKLGIAYLDVRGNVSAKVTVPVVDNITADVKLSGNPAMNLVYPTFGIGMNYDLTKHVSTDVSWIRIQQINNHAFPSTDFVSIGLLYHFG